MPSTRLALSLYREFRRVVGVDLPGAVELLDGLLALAVLQVGYAEVIRREPAEAFRSLQALQHLEGFRRFLLREVDVRAQELDVVADGFRNLAVDAVQREQRVFHLAFLEMNPGQAIGRVVADAFVDRALEHRRDRAAGTMMHAVTQLEIAERKLRVVHVVEKGVELGLVEPVVLADFGIEPLQRLEVIALVRVIERLAEVQILQLFAMYGTRCQTGNQQEPDR